MSKLLRRPTRIECFYCGTQADPRDPRTFRCHACGCWNRYDARGEIMSDEPAMHDEKMNMRSFAKRGERAGGKDRLPSVYGQAVFCRTCQTNQMLIANLLSNYLPPPSDPEYAQRLELLPAYRESVETRYPPVCIDCLPAVEEEIKKRNQMARTSALGGFLQTSRGKGKQRQEVVSQEREKLERQLFAWRYYQVMHLLYHTALQTYKPTWRRIHLLHYPQSPVARWYTYFSLALELIVLTRSALVLRLHRPPPVRLVEQTSKRPFPPHFPQPTSVPHSRTGTPTVPNEPDILASLTLSNNPVLTRAASLPLPSPSHPIFGVPSFASNGSSSSSSTLVNGSSNGYAAPDPDDSSAMFVDDDDDENAMDWSPASPSKNARRPYGHANGNGHAADDNVLLRPQRFFAPEEPTGLEHLFARTIRLADESIQPRRASGWIMDVTRRWSWKIAGLWVVSVVVPLAVIVGGWRWWETRARLQQIHSEL
ncbi:hypothetical protein EIP86_007573 [Pleurotus ostreatoroseus]|nr:hypothetical protein EIP86_007573 [Pleurotus ostreatoroseus]